MLTPSPHTHTAIDRKMDSGVEADVCANCGKEASDAVKLKNCNACHLVKYCCVACQKTHRKQHKKACKKRAAELKDERLYSQGQERPEGDFCPICMLAIPLPMPEHSAFMVCCLQTVCHGCDWAAQKRGMIDCPFCREPRPRDDKPALSLVKKRVAAKDPKAIEHLATKYFFGRMGLKRNLSRAIKLWEEAAELGSIEAHFKLANRYRYGQGVVQDMAKAVDHMEKAAMKGHVASRCNLGDLEFRNGNKERALRHLLIAAKMGDKLAVANVQSMFVEGLATKQQYADALKGYQDAVEEMKSPERDEAQAISFKQHMTRRQR
ncbi:hypothetical protein THAOC_04457 [Thalassiosira oceanica]|uniref:MYND-type domain-containing protein n=1 Tax=Thalassiosira oceanica TaxID=159749 RepID=K0T8J1_THAOC|nr:hypothetical protein THAOC_04457 [Thalassiosira oceanica]|eukprot:EJK73900.1 hypothetical protein THAOC_04457 [Thalassiosira oceanica]